MEEDYKCIYTNSLGVDNVDKMSVEACVKEMSDLINLVKLKNSKASVIVSDIIPRKPCNEINKNMNKKIFEINNLMKSNLIDREIQFFDQSSLYKAGTVNPML